MNKELFTLIRIHHLIGEYFNNDMKKAALWLETKNPLLGNVTPMEMIASGQNKKLLKFIETTLKENQ